MPKAYTRGSCCELKWVILYSFCKSIFLPFYLHISSTICLIYSKIRKAINLFIYNLYLQLFNRYSYISLTLIYFASLLLLILIFSQSIAIFFLSISDIYFIYFTSCHHIFFVFLLSRFIVTCLFDLYCLLFLLVCFRVCLSFSCLLFLFPFFASLLCLLLV